MPFMVLAGFLCAAPIQVNKTKFEWNENDDKQMSIAIVGKGCDRHYGSKSPCLKRFFKIGERDHYPECGAPIKKVD